MTGVVRDGVKVINAEVVLTDGNREFRTSSDREAVYLFKNVPPGTYRLTYSVFEREITVIAGGELVVDIDVVRPVSACCTIREVVDVEIAAGTAQNVSEVSKTIDYIRSEEIRDRAEISLTDAVRTVPGLRIQQLGGYGRTANIKTRGLRNQDTAVLLDGMRFRDPASIGGDASAFLSDLATVNVGRIEILRGSGSSIYGTNAIGGVIDVRTEEPRAFGGNFLAEYGSYGMSRFSGGITSRTRNGRYGQFGFSAGLSRTDLREGLDGEDDADNTSFRGRVDYSPSDSTSLSGRIYFSDAFVRLNTSPDTLGPLPSGSVVDAREGVNFVADRNDPDSFQRSDLFVGQLTVTHVLNSKTILSAGYQGLRTGRENENGVLGPGFQSFFNNTFDGEIHTLNAKFDWIPVLNNRFTAGYEFEREEFDNRGFNEDGSDQFRTGAAQSSNTFYVQNLLGLFGERLQLAGGYRFQRFSLGTPSVSNGQTLRERFTDPVSPPDAHTFDGAVSYYFPRTDTKLRLHAGNGYRAPSLYERFGSFFFFGGFTFIGNPELEPERSFGIDGGIEQALFRDRLRLSATYFYTRVRDQISYLPTDDFGGAAYFNADRRYSRGFETSADFRLFDRTRKFFSYTYTNSDERNFRRLTFLPPATLAGEDRTSFGIPAHQFTLVVTHQFGDRLTLGFDLLATSGYLAPIFSSSTFSTVTYRFEGNRRADLTGRYEIPAFREKVRFVIRGTLGNLFGHEYFENGFRTGGVNGRIGLGIVF